MLWETKTMFLRNWRIKVGAWFPKRLGISILLLVATIGFSQDSTKSALASADTREVLGPHVRLKVLQEQHVVSQNSGPIPEGDLSSKDDVRGTKSLQDAQERTYDGFDVTDPGTLLRGQKETATIRFIDAVLIDDGSGDTWELPIHHSQAIIVGTVQSAKAFGDKDRGNVYSAFRLEVDEVLKQDSSHTISAGDTIVGVRSGGVIHFASGHVTDFVIVGKGFPAIGGRYLFFLTKTSPDQLEYGIGIAYELKNGIVLPLDEGYKLFEGLGTDAFLALVRPKM